MKLVSQNVFDIYAISIEDVSKCSITHFNFIYCDIIRPISLARDVDILFP